jgi:hypothetical protein
MDVGRPVRVDDGGRRIGFALERREQVGQSLWGILGERPASSQREQRFP